MVDETTDISVAKDLAIIILLLQWEAAQSDCLLEIVSKLSTTGELICDKENIGLVLFRFEEIRSIWMWWWCQYVYNGRAA